MDYEVTKAVKDDEVYYTLPWSPLARAEKYEVARRVPAMGGLAELYYKDEGGRLALFRIERSYYGGLRAAIRERSDPALEKDPRRLALLVANEGRIYYRYVLCETGEDLDDLMFYFHESYAPGTHGLEDSGRYARIRVKEIDTGEAKT